MQDLDLDVSELMEPGTIRTAAIAAGAAAIKMNVGICGDRGIALSTRTIDAALRGAREASA